MTQVCIIAEAGVNHNGDEGLAMELVDAAYAAGADIVKFQTFQAKNLASPHARQAHYQKLNTGIEESQREMLSKLELSYDAHFHLLERCKNLGIEFLSTAFDSESLTFLLQGLKLKKLKIPSGEITNAPFLLEHARSGCDLILSTGMATVGEIEAALGVIAFGYTVKDIQPNVNSFREAYVSSEGQKVLREKITLLHCTTQYPTPMRDVNLLAIDTMAAEFGLPVGYSDHSLGIVIPIAAVARGAVVIEKHFTLDRTMPGPDHKASLEPQELKEMVSSVRAVEEALGNGVKEPRPSEIENKIIARKSLMATCKILAGETFTQENISIKRPGNGTSPYRFWELLGMRASRDYREGEVLDE